jgi:UPF0755 protein
VSDLSRRDPPPVRMAHRIGDPAQDGEPDDDGGDPSASDEGPLPPASGPAASGTMSRTELGRQGGRNGGYGRLEPAGGHHRLRGLLVVVAMGALVLVVLGSVGRPILRTLAVDLAQANPQTMRMPFVADLVREQLGTQLTDPAGTDASPVQFVVPTGASAADIATLLAGQQLLSEPLAFEFVAITSGQAGSIQAGTYYLNQQMTPAQLLQALQDPVPVNPYLTMALRSGLRIEQITAYLETLPLQKDVAKGFYELAISPTAQLRADYPFLAALPAGRSLEGFLGWGTFSIKPDSTGEGIVRLLLTTWGSQVGPAIVSQATTNGAALYRTLALASIVNKEVAVDSERTLVAGVYTNRLDPKKWSTGLLEADPTVFYANDTMQLALLPLDEWSTYSFWNPVTIANVKPPAALESYQTYDHPGLPAGPICSPTLADIQAAMAPDTSDGYFYFVAKNDGSHTHAFAKTNAEFERLLKLYGYIP